MYFVELVCFINFIKKECVDDQIDEKKKIKCAFLWIYGLSALKPQGR